MVVNTGIDFLTGLPIEDFLDIAKEVAEAGKKTNLRAGAGNRR